MPKSIYRAGQPFASMASQPLNLTKPDLAAIVRIALNIQEGAMIRQNQNMAIHEAGHAVAAILLRVRIKYASILPDDTSEGRVLYKPGRREPSIERDMAKMVTAFAGMLAERAEGGRPHRYRWDHDRQQATWLAFDLAGGDDELTRLCLALARRRATLLLAQHADEIRRVATALLERQRLDEADLRVIVWPSLRPIVAPPA